MSEVIKQSKRKPSEKIKLKGVILPEPMTKEQRREIVERIIGGLSRLGFREEDFGDLICGEADYGEESNVTSRK
jgi:hypothetical protein